jgi:MYXO-CTERM domain-containing protein
MWRNFVTFIAFIISSLGVIVPVVAIVAALLWWWRRRRPRVPQPEVVQAKDA